MLVLATVLALVPQGASAQLIPAGHTSVLVVMDGLRPDYVTPELMPRLHAFGAEGVTCEAHHSVFPTVTRVNATSMSTGAYPSIHGILGNTIRIAEVNSAKGISTGNAKLLMAANEATGGKLVTATTMGEALERQGKKMLVASSGSPGSSYLVNHRSTAGGTLNSELTLPASLEPHLVELFGPMPPETMPNTQQTHRAVDGYLRYGLDELKPVVTVIWITDPDHTAHESGIGSDLTKTALREVDTEFGRILDTLQQRGLAGQTNIFVASDHGFSSQTGEMNLSKLLQDNGLKKDKDSDDVVVVEGSIYVKDHDPVVVKRIVRLLQSTPWVGAIFTRAAVTGSPMGMVPGTLALGTVHGDHPRAGDVLVSANWSNDPNEFGYKGRTTLGGVAGHGTSSPYDLHAVLFAGGPDVKRGLRSAVPTGNVDLAPTLLFLSGVTSPMTMKGRVLHEILSGGVDPGAVGVWEHRESAEAAWENGRYRLDLQMQTVNGTDYIDFTAVER